MSCSTLVGTDSAVRGSSTALRFPGTQAFNSGGTDGQAIALLHLRSLGAEVPDFEVNLRANRAENLDCEARLIPVYLDFGPHLVGDGAELSLELQAMGKGDCTIQEVVARDCSEGCPLPGSAGALSPSFEVIDAPAPGAIVLALRNPGHFRSVSAFAPILQPSAVPWGQKAFSAYLGGDRTAWALWDATELLGSAAERLPILID